MYENIFAQLMPVIAGLVVGLWARRALRLALGIVACAGLIATVAICTGHAQAIEENKALLPPALALGQRLAHSVLQYFTSTPGGASFGVLVGIAVRELRIALVK